jgi:hypothetical protein
MSTRNLLWPLGLLLFAGFTPALAGDPGVPVDRGIQYGGRLDQNGVPFDGMVKMRLRVCKDAQAELCPWTSAVRDVQVFAGAFTTMLGGDDAFAELLAEGLQLWVEVSVGDSADTLALLGQRQPVRPAGQSIWSLKAAHATTADLLGGKAEAALEVAHANTADLLGGRAEGQLRVAHAQAAASTRAGSPLAKLTPFAVTCNNGRQREVFGATQHLGGGRYRITLPNGRRWNSRTVAVATAWTPGVIATVTGSDGDHPVVSQVNHQGNQQDGFFCAAFWDVGL